MHRIAKMEISMFSTDKWWELAAQSLVMFLVNGSWYKLFGGQLGSVFIFKICFEQAVLLLGIYPKEIIG